jgi:predicted phosphodiesterase
MSKIDVAREYLDKFPEIPTRSMAALLLKNEPAVFLNFESARACVRAARGVLSKDRRCIHTHPNPGKVNPFDDLPEPLSEKEPWDVYRLTGQMRVGILSDIHLPYQDQDALKAALAHLKKWQPTHILLNGDTADCAAVSFWEKDPRERNLPLERERVIQFLTTLRRLFPEAVIIAKDGNHEERLDRFMRVKAPELLGLPQMEIDKLFNYDQFGVTRVKDNRPIMLGQHLNVIHGHEFKFAISNPVNPARGFYLRAKTNVLAGHLHRTSHHPERDLNGKVISAWSVGCLCTLRPQYSRLNNWNHGLATVEVHKDGTFQLFNYQIIDGKVY